MDSTTIGRPRRRASIQVRPDDDGAVLFDPESRAEHRLNTTALALWELCDGQTTAAEIIDAACTIFRAPRRAVERDVVRVLEDFRERRIVDWE